MPLFSGTVDHAGFLVSTTKIYWGYIGVCRDIWEMAGVYSILCSGMENKKEQNLEHL